MAPQVDINGTLGAAFIGYSLSCMVFGMLTIQCVTYFQRFRMDRALYKCLVTSIWTLEFVDQAFIAHVLYYYTISNFRNPLAGLGGKVVWSLIVQLLLGATVGTIVKICFALRVWRFSKHNIYITAPIFVLIFGQLGLAIVYAVQAFERRELRHAGELRPIASLSLGSGVLTDISTASALTYFLRKMRTRSHREDLDSLVYRLTIYAINTGALTSAFSICTLVLYDVNPLNFEFLAFYFILSKLYAVSLLATLNTRTVVRGQGVDHERTGASESTVVSVGNGRTNMLYGSQHNGLEVNVQREVTMTDYWDWRSSPKEHPSRF